MAFENVIMRTADGQEYGPVAMDALKDWHRDGRVPADALIIDSKTNAVQPVTAFFPPAMVPPPPMGVPAQAQSALTATDHLIPVKNPKALIAYYCGVFGIIFFPLGVIALIFGIMGIKDARIFGVGKTHGIVGVVLGSLESLILLAVIVLILVGILSNS